jgi:hypothetical protein
MLRGSGGIEGVLPRHARRVGVARAGLLTYDPGVDLAPYLRAHAYLQVERPPLLWHVDTDEVPFLRVLGQMLAYGLRGGRELGELVLNVNNVVVEPDPEGNWIEPGEYVALTVRHPVPPESESKWRPETDTAAPFDEWAEDLCAARFVLGYTRILAEGGSVTVWLRRAT